MPASRGPSQVGCHGGGDFSRHRAAGERRQWAQQDSNVQSRDYAYHFGFRRRAGARSWSGLCLHRGASPVGASVSSLYTFPSLGLARRWHGQARPKRSPTLRRYYVRISPDATLIKSRALPLSYGPVSLSLSSDSPPGDPVHTSPLGLSPASRYKGRIRPIPRVPMSAPDHTPPTGPFHDDLAKTAVLGEPAGATPPLGAASRYLPGELHARGGLGEVLRARD